ncbi:MAG: flagellar biosynthesis protein FliQ [Phycisphaerae bacterium]
MTLDQATDLLRQSLMLTLLMAAPMLICGLVVGVTVSLIQAVTQIQEQTLTFVPKIASMIIAAAVLMPWIGERMLEYASALFSMQGMP